LSGFFVTILILTILTFLTLFALFVFTCDTKDLHNMWSCVDSSGCSSENLLKEEIGLLGFVTSDNLGGLAVNLLSNDELGQLKQFE
jgi:hypothetical protein